MVLCSKKVANLLLQCPCAKGHHGINSVLSVEGLPIGAGMPTWGLLNNWVGLASEAFVIRAPTKNLIAVAFDFTFANNDVAVAVYLGGVHGAILIERQSGGNRVLFCRGQACKRARPQPCNGRISE